MSFSLQLLHGDLGLNGTSLGTVEGWSKLTQDLSSYILTAMGEDPDHPEYGSLIDGGVTPEGQYVEGAVGASDWSRAGMILQSEIQRIATAYQNQQISRNQADLARFGKPTLTADEVLVNVQKVELFQNEDQLLAIITITTGTGSIQLNLPISSGQIITR